MYSRKKRKILHHIRNDGDIEVVFRHFAYIYIYERNFGAVTRETSINASEKKNKSKLKTEYTRTYFILFLLHPSAFKTLLPSLQRHTQT